MKRVTFDYVEGPDLRSVSHFLGEIKRIYGVENHAVYFRGQGTPTEGILPSIGRRQYYLGRSIRIDCAMERSLLLRFRRHAYEHFGRVPTEWETLFLARHYGMPTRLLDWTSNPLVALYFAAFYDSESTVPAPGEEREAVDKLGLDGTVWGIQTREDIEELDVLAERRPPLRIRGIKLIHPFNPTPRMSAQSGFFTLHGDPWTDLVACAGRAYAPGELDLAKLVRWRVASRHKTAIILELERLAINSRTLFPDLEGLARGLWQTEIIRRVREE